MIRHGKVRAALFGMVVLIGSIGLATGAHAATKPVVTKPAAKPAPATENQPSQLGVFGPWGAYASDTPKGRVCYALAQPKERLPANLTRDPAYLFVSTRPSENVRNEVSFVLGFPPKDGVDSQVVIGKLNFVVSVKAAGNAGWLKNPSDDAALIEQMKKNPVLLLKSTSKRGNAMSDIYALNGLAQALEQVKKACP